MTIRHDHILITLYGPVDEARLEREKQVAAHRAAQTKEGTRPSWVTMQGK